MTTSLSINLNSRKEYDRILNTLKLYTEEEIIINDGREITEEDFDSKEEFEDQQKCEFEGPQFVFIIDHDRIDELKEDLEGLKTIEEIY